MWSLTTTVPKEMMDWPYLLVLWIGSNKIMTSIVKFMEKPNLRLNLSWYFVFYAGHSPLRILRCYVWKIRPNWRHWSLIEAKRREASLVKLELIDRRMHDLPQQDGISLLPLPPLLQLPPPLFRIHRRRSGCLWNRIRIINFHANVLIIHRHIIFTHTFIPYIIHTIHIIASPFYTT